MACCCHSCCTHSAPIDFPSRDFPSRPHDCSPPRPPPPPYWYGSACAQQPGSPFPALRALAAVPYASAALPPGSVGERDGWDLYPMWDLLYSPTGFLTATNPGVPRPCAYYITNT